MPPIITVENLGKRYTLRHEPGAGGYRRLSEDLMAAVKKPFSRAKGKERGAASRRGAGSSEQGARSEERGAKSEEQGAGSEAQCSLAAPGSSLAASSLAAPGSPLAAEDFWALKNVSFEVQQGEVLGIIGRNGAGKSTLLKILSRITEPTEGRVSIRGRVASLLEVGTGFHPELTGRENVFLNGAILGMTRAEIRRKFDEIVAFAEVEKFLDTPVKRYSSGMYVRLAFAVAAHLEPEILVVDEVLAVGDAEFQKKCLGKMGEVAREGRTVLFVSHNINAIQQLCTRALHIDSGTIRRLGSDVFAVTNEYLFGKADDDYKSEWINNGKEYENPYFKALRFGLYDADGHALSANIANNQIVWVQIEGLIERADPTLTIGYAAYSEAGQPLYCSYHTDAEQAVGVRMSEGTWLLKSRLPPRLLNDGTYRLELSGGLHCRCWLYEPTVNAPSICLTIQGGLSDSPYWIGARPGILARVLDWQCDCCGLLEGQLHNRARNGDSRVLNSKRA